jgi:CRP-like cAMP-binding protein
VSLARHLAVMRNAPFLRVLSEDALKLLAFGSEAINLKPRQLLFEAAEEADGAALVLGGQLRLVPQAVGAQERLVGVGQLVDELALVVPVKRGASAIAYSTCEILLLPRQQMLRILEEYPASAEKLRVLLARRTAALIADVEKIADRFPKE